MNRGQEVLIMTVDITDTQKDRIIVHEFDSPEVLAKDFITRYKLNPKLVGPLSKEIFSNLNEVLKQPRQLPSQSNYTESVVSSNENLGEKLYFKGIKKIEKNENMKQALKIKIEEEEGKELTFKPRINPVSNIIAQRMSNRSQDSVRKKESTIARVNNEKQAEELSACTFIPKINPNSARMLEYRKKSNSDRFTELYEEANNRKMRQESLLKQNLYSFKPEICSTHNISSSGDRLYYKKSNEEMMFRKSDDLKDPITGQEYFIPQINKGKYFRNRELPIGDHLYNYQKRPIENSDPYTRNPNLEAKKRSEELIQKAKLNRYAEIFEQLNPNNKGMISHETIDKKYVEPIAYKLMIPLLDELKEGNETLDFEQFCYSMDNLLKILSPDERDVFLIFKRFKEDSLQSNPKKSASISEITGVYNRQVEKRTNCLARLEIEREKKYRNELDGCTFHPQTTPYRVLNSRMDIA
jgi:hypothetical protein